MQWLPQRDSSPWLLHWSPLHRVVLLLDSSEPLLKHGCAVVHTVVRGRPEITERITELFLSFFILCGVSSLVR